LTAAHRAEIIHRDIKPDNIYLVPGSDGFQAKLLDFGIALSAHSDERVTQAGVLIGTPAYMSPEQVQGKYLDEGTDIYSLACVTWEALVGRRMVRGKQIAEVLLNLISDAVVPVSRYLSWAPQAVDELFESALAKSRLSRPRDVESWATALATLLEDYESDVPGWPSQAWMGGAPSVSSAEDMQATTIGSDPLARKAKVKKEE
jgi:serine/threonine protein kinase